jgi:Family of unknown function (DUF5715)
MTRRLFVFVLTVAAAVAVWGVVRYRAAQRNRPLQSASDASHLANTPSADAWVQAVEKVKADRGELATSAAIVIPPELQHYSDRHWFLATQVAEIAKYNVHTCQDYVDLAAMIERAELVSVPAVTETYVLFGVGAKADDEVFTRYEGDQNIELYTEAQLSDAYRRLENQRLEVQSQIASLSKSLERGRRAAIRRGSRVASRPREAQEASSLKSVEQVLKSIDEDKAQLDRFYGQTESRQKLMRDYESLQILAKNFVGRSYNLENPSDRQALKVNMLRSLRPEALKILEEVAFAYHRQFDRPLPVSSLVRPDQYQHALSRVNRNAVLIETPPHSTGLSFDIDYRYMSGAEQTFLMAELARIKNEGRIEVIRERSANYHMFAFINGTRPSDDLITASLDKASLPGAKAQDTPSKPAKVKSRTQKARTAKSKARKRHR